METIRQRLQAIIDDAIELNASGLRQITKEQIDEAIGFELHLARQDNEITPEESRELWEEYTA